MSSLSIENHSRNTEGMRYIYRVLSRRSGGISLGINLNPNNACNWRCIYCQVPSLKRGMTPFVDLSLLEQEMRHVLSRQIAENKLSLIRDIAFSGNGEPTGAKNFDQAVSLVLRLMKEFKTTIPLRLITNGSFFHRPVVQKAVSEMGQTNAEVWFKIDGGTKGDISFVNQCQTSLEKIRQNYMISRKNCDTWIQACFFKVNGKPPERTFLDHWVSLIASLSPKPTGIYLYGLARESSQPESSHLSKLPRSWFEGLQNKLSELKCCQIVINE